MSILKDKSEFSLSSAKLLIESTYFSPSVHCSYYSCIQLMLHYIHEKYRIAEDQLRIDQKNSGQQSHEYLISFVGAKIHAKCRESSRSFNNSINTLKGLRNKADYKNYSIDIKIGNSAYTMAAEIIRILKLNC